jgi:hypothetical protein
MSGPYGSMSSSSSQHEIAGHPAIEARRHKSFFGRQRILTFEQILATQLADLTPAPIDLLTIQTMQLCESFLLGCHNKFIWNLGDRSEIAGVDLIEDQFLSVGGVEARRTADQLACEAWNKRMLAFQGPLQQLKGRPPISSSAPCLMMPCSKALGSSSSAA